MNIEFHKIPETIAIIRGWYSEEELDMIWRELEVVCSPFILVKAGDTLDRSAIDADSQPLKKGHGLFLDYLYENVRHRSFILKLNEKLFNKEFIERLIKEDPAFTYFMRTDIDFTLANYYDTQDEYQLHWDKSIYTSNVILWKTPRKFDGGKFLLTSNELDFDIQSNDMIIFPGYVPHRVTPLVPHDDYIPWKSGRYSLANFINFRT